jgi:hypothetical protein
VFSMPSSIFLKHDLCPSVLRLYPGYKLKKRHRHFLCKFLIFQVIFLSMTVVILPTELTRMIMQRWTNFLIDGFSMVLVGFVVTLRNLKVAMSNR